MFLTRAYFVVERAFLVVGARVYFLFIGRAFCAFDACLLFLARACLVVGRRLLVVGRPDHSCPPSGWLTQEWESELLDDMQYL